MNTNYSHEFDPVGNRTRFYHLVTDIFSTLNKSSAAVPSSVHEHPNEVTLHLAEKHFPENHLSEKHFPERSFSTISNCQKSHMPE